MIIHTIVYNIYCMIIDIYVYLYINSNNGILTVYTLIDDVIAICRF